MLNGKVALITGSGSGIGRETAVRMAKSNAKVIVSDMNISSANETMNLIKELGKTALAFECNVTKADEVDICISKAIEKLGKIDILVNCAGVFKEVDFLNISKEMWELHIGVNLTGTFNCIKAVVPYMVKNNKGSIINVSSVDAFQGCTGYAPYCAAKAGVLGLTKDAAIELAQYGIRVNAIAPGIIETNMTKDRISNNKDSYLAKIPLKRIGRAEDIANASVFLASDMSDYITGHTLHVNGGMRFD